MNYIVFDLEWNQSPGGKKCSDQRLPFEIIEIGAVKLSEQGGTVDSFHRLIKPQVYNWIHDSIHDVIHVDYKDLADGIPFSQAVREFLDWCGPEWYFFTWGSQDITELQRNMKYYEMLSLLPGPITYYDVQKLFGMCFGRDEDMSCRSLEYAINHLGIQKEQEFHRALSDAYYTAEILKRMDVFRIWPYSSIDVYQNPRNKKEEIYISYPDYDKFISREFKDREKVIKDREVASTRCPVCHLPARKKIHWFINNSRTYECVSFCQEHGYIRGKVRIRKTEGEQFYAIKTLRLTDIKEAEAIREKHESLRRRKQIKRLSEKEI